MGQVRRVGAAERRARLVARHHLGGTPGREATRAPTPGTPTAPDTPTGVAHDILALHATDAATVYLSAWARVPGLLVGDVDKSLYEDRMLVRMLGMRRTMFVVPADAVPMIQAACTDDVAARLRRALVQVIVDGGIAVDGDAWLTEVAASVTSKLTSLKAATGAELSRAEPRLASKIMVAEGKSYGGEISLTSRILNMMSAEGLIVRGRPRGGWTSTQYEWAASATWLGEPTEPVPAATARVELARRWLRAFGPAPISDLKWWTGWTGGQVKQALGQIETVEADLDGQPGIMLAADDEPAGDDEPRAVLLPALDPTPMGWQDRDWFLGPHREALFDRSGNIGPTIWWDGRIVGGWAQRADGELVLRLLEDIGADATRLADAEADRLWRWMGPLRFVAKFRTPLERELTQ